MICRILSAVKTLGCCLEGVSDLVSNHDPAEVQTWTVQLRLNVYYRTRRAIPIVGSNPTLSTTFVTDSKSTS